MDADQDVRTSKDARRSALDRDVAMALAATEYDRAVDLLKDLTADQWHAPTDCPGWDVRAMAGHVLGMMQMAGSVSELVRQQVASQRAAKKSGADTLSSLTALQVASNISLSAEDVVEQMRSTGPRAVRFRRRTPSLIRARTMPEAQNVGGVLEPWTFGFLFDVILTRDPFMHRIDISRAVGVPMRATADHEGVLVDDIVREWAGRHGQPYRLELLGPAGGSWGDDVGERIAMDAFEFCRVVGGRGAASGLLAQQVPF